MSGNMLTTGNIAKKQKTNNKQKTMVVVFLSKFDSFSIKTYSIKFGGIDR